MTSISARIIFSGVLLAMMLSPLHCSPHCDHHYGPCKEQPFLPAPPGKTPACAKPGSTFCEKIEHYPVQLVRYLVERWGYDYDSLLSDESRDDFNYRAPLPYGPHHHPAYSYGPSKAPVSSYFPQLVTGSTGNGSALGPYPDRRYKLQQHQPEFVNPAAFNLQPYALLQQQQPLVTQHNPDEWWDRYARANEHGQLVSPAVNIVPPPLHGRRRRGRSTRSKRQTGAATAAGQSILCPTTTRFIMPKAAMNNRGNWMYVVNLNEVNDKYTQLVGTETCASNQCSGLCSIPTGYTSRCEQQYVQKRLVAVQGAGDQLYTDVFWFPHCCLCTITQNNG